MSKLRTLSCKLSTTFLTTTTLLIGCALTACSPKISPPAAAPAPSAAPAESMKPVAGIKDLMAYMIDPAADFLWQSVSTTMTKAGMDEKQPRTDEEWNEVRRQAIILTESANLLLVEGRHVARENEQLEDHGLPGNLTAAESEKTIAENRAVFVSFAQALREAGVSMLKAADTKSPQALLDNGDTLDQVCEGCHLKFWYPGQGAPSYSSSSAAPKAN
jgi:hypothetical protein